VSRIEQRVLAAWRARRGPSDGDMAATGLEAGDLHITHHTSFSHEVAETAAQAGKQASKQAGRASCFPPLLNRSPGWTMFRRALACTSQKPPLSFPAANACFTAGAVPAQPRCLDYYTLAVETT
jgi:hypothetical protein